AAPKRCTAGSGRRPLEKDPHSGNLASGLPVLEHSESRSVTVVFFRTARTATVSVTDEGHGCASVPDLPGAEQENGRGLLIIDTLAGRWGQRKTDGGFTVWAEIAVRSAPGPAGQPTGPAK
ncbi:ATP-binding protein, partial [Streptomyces celluloflavus]